MPVLYLYVWIMAIYLLCWLFLGDIILQTEKFCSICYEEYCRNPAYYRTQYSFQNPNDNLGYENVRSQSINFYEVCSNQCYIHVLVPIINFSMVTVLSQQLLGPSKIIQVLKYFICDLLYHLFLSTLKYTNTIISYVDT